MTDSRPQFILDYLDAFAHRNPNQELPIIWDRGDGWVGFICEGWEYAKRKSQIIAMTGALHAATLRKANGAEQ